MVRWFMTLILSVQAVCGLANPYKKHCSEKSDFLTHLNESSPELLHHIMSMLTGPIGTDTQRQSYANRPYDLALVSPSYVNAMKNLRATSRGFQSRIQAPVLEMPCLTLNRETRVTALFSGLDHSEMLPRLGNRRVSTSVSGLSLESSAFSWDASRIPWGEFFHAVDVENMTEEEFLEFSVAMQTRFLVLLADSYIAQRSDESPLSEHKDTLVVLRYLVASLTKSFYEWKRNDLNTASRRRPSYPYMKDFQTQRNIMWLTQPMFNMIYAMDAFWESSLHYVSDANPNAHDVLWIHNYLVNAEHETDGDDEDGMDAGPSSYYSDFSPALSALMIGRSHGTLQLPDTFDLESAEDVIMGLHPNFISSEDGALSAESVDELYTFLQTVSDGSMNGHLFFLQDFGTEGFTRSPREGALMTMVQVLCWMRDRDVYASLFEKLRGSLVIEDWHGAFPPYYDDLYSGTRRSS